MTERLSTMTLTHDDNGNLTDDGVYKYTCDAFNRLTQVRQRVDVESVVAAYEYDGLFRRTVKAVSNSGAGIVAFSDDLDMNGTPDADGIQAGDRSEHYFYAGWRLVETRDGSDNTLGQFVYGTRYIDEPICYDRNTDLTIGGSADDDCLDASGSQRYTYHQDANWRVVALTNESGAVVERYDYTAYGEPTVFVGVPGAAGGSGTGGESGHSLLVSSVGNPLTHQGLFRDDESGTYQNRFRQLHSRSGRFMQRDPANSGHMPRNFEYVLSSPFRFRDALGLMSDLGEPHPQDSRCEGDVDAPRSSTAPRDPGPNRFETDYNLRHPKRRSVPCDMSVMAGCAAACAAADGPLPVGDLIALGLVICLMREAQSKPDSAPDEPDADAIRKWCENLRDWYLAAGGQNSFDAFRNCLHNNGRWDTDKWPLPHGATGEDPPADF